MRYNDFTMLPIHAFTVVGGRMTYEGGGGGGGGKGGGSKSGAPIGNGGGMSGMVQDAAAKMQPQPPSATSAAPPPAPGVQAARSPDALRSRVSRGNMGQANSTMLTGPSGVDTPSTVGTNTLLGG